MKQIEGESVVGLHRLTMELVEKELLDFVLNECDGNCSRAMKMLGISRNTLLRKIKQYKIKVKRTKP